MKLSSVLIFFILVFALSQSEAYDCSSAKPFLPVGFQKVQVFVGHLFWKTGRDGIREEVIEEVCSTQSPIAVPILDLRGREEEWFYCSRAQLALQCSTTFQNLPTKIEIRPAVVIRSWNGSSALDHHFHAYVIPIEDSTRSFDLFSRNINPRLTPSPITLDAAGGGRGENSGLDSYYVRIDFE